MDKILFINTCVRPDSRTLDLAKTVLSKIKGNVEQVDLYHTSLNPLDLKGMEKRGAAASTQNFDDPVFELAKQFASADVIVVAAPYWDMMFPAVLKTYFENITVGGITFRYTPKGCPEGMCKGKSLYYVTTAGGFIGNNDFGFSYVKALCQNFFGISEVFRYTAEGLDIAGADVDGILQTAKANILQDLQ